MEVFKQTEDGILGALDQKEKLAHADEARILVISDSHRNTANLKRILNQFGTSCDALVFCGDGAYDLAECLNDNFKSNEKKAKEKDVFPNIAAFVRGNGDPSYIPVDFDPVPQKLFNNPQDMNYHLQIPQSAILEVCNKKILISHGHIQGVDYDDSLFLEEAQRNDCNIILHGHTHVAREKYCDNGTKIICPGSISLPRMGQQKSFCILNFKGNSLLPCFMQITATGFESWTPGW